MRLFFLMITFFFFVSVKSQTVLSPALGVSQQNEVHLNNTNPKWFFSSYRGLSASVSFFRGGNATVFSAPMGWQLNRRITNNLYAFANVTVAPSYISINPSYLSVLNKNFNNSPLNQNSFGLYPAASLGLMYVNDAKTFSISGSISAEKTVYPGVPYYPVNHTTQSPVFLPER
jgi:hypothetical protein